MEDYDYRGYIITEDSGYFYTGDYSFYSLDDAMDWIDDQFDGQVDDELEDIPANTSNTYHIYYVTKGYDRGYDEFIEAHDEDEAIKQLRRMHRDIAYIADCYKVGR